MRVGWVNNKQQTGKDRFVGSYDSILMKLLADEFQNFITLQQYTSASTSFRRGKNEAEQNSTFLGE
jgi:hypothetical protein